MKIQSQKAYEYKGKDHFKSWVILKDKYLKQLDWKKGDELEVEIKGNSLVLTKKKEE